MESEAAKDKGEPTPSSSLPPVTPPSGRFIVQLFFVPGLIVVLAVLLWLAFHSLWSGQYTPAQFLKQLDNPNPDIRWRGAYDLAQVLKRQESLQLKADPEFALELALRLRKVLDELIAEEKTLAAGLTNATEKQKDEAWKKLSPLRDTVQFLASSLGDFLLPIGVPLLCEIALREDRPDFKHHALLRGQVVWALGNLGENVKAFASLPQHQQATILSRLEGEVSGEGPTIGKIQEAALKAELKTWGKTALFYLKKKNEPWMQAFKARSILAAAPQGSLAVLPWVFRWPEPLPGIVEVDRTLAQCALSENRFLREMAAMALNFWEGDLVEPTLIRLARDPGFGTVVRVQEGK